MLGKNLGLAACRFEKKRLELRFGVGVGWKGTRSQDSCCFYFSNNDLGLPLWWEGWRQEAPEVHRRWWVSGSWSVIVTSAPHWGLILGWAVKK